MARARSSWVARVATAGALAALLPAPPSPVRAEVRTYLQATPEIASLRFAETPRSLRLFLREENHFRDEGVVYTKISVGLQMKTRRWFTARAYYADKDLAGTHHANKDLVAAEFVVGDRWGRVGARDRHGNEWHVSDAFYRYRNCLAVSWNVPRAPLSIWSSEEFRYDSDQGRVNLNDVRLGATLKKNPTLSIDVFVDSEQARRSKPDWVHTTFLGIAVSARL